jgi:hypothetical protein
MVPIPSAALGQKIGPLQDDIVTWDPAIQSTWAHCLDAGESIIAQCGKRRFREERVKRLYYLYYEVTTNSNVAVYQLSQSANAFSPLHLMYQTTSGAPYPPPSISQTALGVFHPPPPSVQAEAPQLQAAPAVQAQPTFIQTPEMAKPVERGAPPQVVFTGPVFIGYPLPQTPSVSQPGSTSTVEKALPTNHLRFHIVAH